MFTNYRRGSVIIQTNLGWFSFDLFSAYWLKKMTKTQLEQHIRIVQVIINIVIAERRWQCRRNLISLGTLSEYLIEVKKI